MVGVGYAFSMILYLAAVMALAHAMDRIEVHGHRGARAMLPENTLPAFEYAIQAGVDVLELDLAVTRDDVLVVSHDPEMNPAICQGPAGTRVIRQMTFSQLRRWDCGSKPHPDFPKQKAAPGAVVPSLDEVFALAPRGDFRFNVETKIFRDKPHLTPPPEEFARLLAEAIRRHKLEARVIVQSFDFRTLHAMKKLLPGVRLSALYAGLPKSFSAIAREAGAEIVSPHHRLVTPERVRQAHEAGVEVIPWTANTPEEWDKLIDAGVDAIITDDPAELIAHLKRKGRR